MRVLILGAAGRVGSELARHLRPDHEVLAPPTPTAEPADLDALLARIRESRPDLLVNAASVMLEADPADPDTTLSWNVRVPGLLATEADRWGIPLVHFSTASVFDGRKGDPYRESDPPAPAGPGGRTALLGEQSVATGVAPSVVFRVGAVYDQRDLVGRPPRRADTRDPRTRVSPTWARDVAVATWRALEALTDGQPQRRAVLGARLHPGSGRVFHLAAEGGASGAEIEAYVEQVGSRLGLPTWTDATSSTNGSPPLDLRLDASRAEMELAVRIPDWRVGVEACLRDIAARRELLAV